MQQISLQPMRTPIQEPIRLCGFAFLEFPPAMSPNEAFSSRTSHLGNDTGMGVSSSRDALWFRPDGVTVARAQETPVQPSLLLTLFLQTGHIHFQKYQPLRRILKDQNANPHASPSSRPPIKRLSTSPRTLCMMTKVLWHVYVSLVSIQQRLRFLYECCCL
jgi:hypothetical protein